MPSQSEYCQWHFVLPWAPLETPVAHLPSLAMLTLTTQSSVSVFPTGELLFFSLWLIDILWGDILICKYPVYQKLPSRFSIHWGILPNQSLLQQLQNDTFPTLLIHPHLLVSTQYFTLSKNPPFYPISLNYIYLFIIDRGFWIVDFPCFVFNPCFGSFITNEAWVIIHYHP